jgi:hypothetical protein
MAECLGSGAFAVGGAENRSGVASTGRRVDMTQTMASASHRGNSGTACSVLVFDVPPNTSAPLTRAFFALSPSGLMAHPSDNPFVLTNNPSVIQLLCTLTASKSGKERSAC